MPRVSVVIPVYNVEKYLAQCLDSIISQTLRDIEIICVNDGATDSSPSILAEYATKDSRIVVINQENAGAGVARNNGFLAAKGDYLSFLDSDDFFAPTMLEVALAEIEKKKADFIVFRSDIFNEKRKAFEPCPWTIREALVPPKPVFTYRDVERDLFRLFVGWAWDKLYRRDFIAFNHLQFQNLRTTNDMFFVFAALVKAGRICVIDDVLAHHRSSISDSLSATREKSWNCFYLALSALKNELLTMGIYEELTQSYVNYALHFSLWNVNTITGLSFEKLYAKLQEEYFDTLGVSKYPKEFFYNATEYAQYLRIKNSPMSVYLLDTIETLRLEIARLKQGAPTTSGNHTDSVSYRIGRIITFVPRIFLRFIRSCRKHGLKHTIGQGMKKLGKLRRRHR